MPGLGDDALLIRQDETDAPSGSTRTWSSYFSLVRVGDTVLTTAHSLGEGTVSRDVALRLAAASTRRGACLRSTC